MSESLVISTSSGNLAELSGMLGFLAWGSVPEKSKDAST
jgi:hypothetical protein